MSLYGSVAVRATQLFLHESFDGSLAEAWAGAVREFYPTSEDSQEKGCPRGAYLGICEAGIVVDVPAGDYTQSRKNKAYAIAAVQLLVKNEALADAGPVALWHRVMGNSDKRHNSQMDVVLALWEHRLIDEDRVRELAVGDTI